MCIYNYDSLADQVERKIDSLKGCYNQQKRAYAKTGSEGGRKGKGWIHYQRMASFLGRLDYAASQTSVITPQSYVVSFCASISFSTTISIISLFVLFVKDLTFTSMIYISYLVYMEQFVKLFIYFVQYLFISLLFCIATA